MSGCAHPRGSLTYLYTYEDFWDGDEDDVYRCGECGETVTRYIPR